MLDTAPMMALHNTPATAHCETGTSLRRPAVAATPTITSNLSLLSDTDLTRATDRAYREAIRCWADYRRAPSGDVGPMLLTSAEAADEWWSVLKVEAERRLEEVSAGAFGVTGMADRMDVQSTDVRDYGRPVPVTSPRARRAQARDLPSKSFDRFAPVKAVQS
jgi:hypothetical protein